MKYHAGQEQQLLTDILSFSHNPLGFAEYAYPWGQKGSPLERHSLRQWQRQCLTDIGDHIKDQQGKIDLDFYEMLKVYQELIASGRGTGKSALFGILANWMVSTHLGASVIVTANTETQLRTKTFPEFGKWFTMALNSHWWDPESLAVKPLPWIRNLIKDQLRIDPQYWGVTGQNWSMENPDAFAGAHNMYGLAVFMDESASIPEPIWTVTSGFFTELTPFRLWMGFSNPRRNNGAFHARFHDKSHQKFWRTRHLDARTVEGTDKQVYQAIIDTHGAESDQAKVEVYGQFPEQGEGQLIATPIVIAAQQRTNGMGVNNDEPVIVGVDPAPRGRTVIRARQGRDARSIPRKVLNGKDNTQISDAVVEYADMCKADAIVVDAGNGTGVIDDLKHRGVKVYEVWFGGSTPNSQAEFALMGGHLWAKLRDWLPTGCIDDASELYNDLTRRTWQWFGGREDNKKMLTSKRDMAREGVPSPDDADALALTFYPKLPSRSSRVRRKGGRSRGSISAGTGECNF